MLKVRWPGQTNLLVVMSIRGIEYYDIFDKNMTKGEYATYIPIIGSLATDSEHPFSCYLHDNAFDQDHELFNAAFGVGKWTKYMARPCTKPSTDRLTPKTRRPVRVPKNNCTCEFSEPPWHAPFNPKLNLTEEVFAKLDRQMTENKIEDQKLGRTWIMRGSDKKRFWREELRRAIVQVNADKEFFKKQYRSFKTRCQAFVNSGGKRLRTTKW